MESAQPVTSTEFEALLTEASVEASVNAGILANVPKTTKPIQKFPKEMNVLKTIRLDKNNQNEYGNDHFQNMRDSAAKINRSAFVVKGDDLWVWMWQTKRGGTVFIIDLRLREGEAVVYDKGRTRGANKAHGFRGALHLPQDDAQQSTPNQSAFENNLVAWMADKKNKDAVDAMLAADNVIIHCVQGTNRSPPAVSKYLELVDQGKLKPTNPNQKVCLLYMGALQAIQRLSGQVMAKTFGPYNSPPKNGGESQQEKAGRERFRDALMPAYFNLIDPVLEEW